MRYSFDQYDKHGFLKAPVLLWLVWLFLAKALVVFVVAGASRESGAKILEIIYPDHDMFYVGIVLSFPSLASMWLFGLRSPDRERINRLVTWGRCITMITVLLQMLHTGYLVYLDNGGFHWANAITLVMLLWFALYLFNSRLVKDCFRMTLAKD
ncbi:DUF2919 domain-containing protein [Vibrio kagoshimensis]|uniref:DUF2919 domain-containing protein n=1 Tax=Vibrio kagoshimensis TaxID=2910244 RepID=UPI003D1BA7CD